MIPEIQYNLDRLRAASVLYGDLSGKTEAEVIAKQGPKLGFNIYQGLRAVMPGKGAIRKELEERLAQGLGIKVRPHVQESVEAKYSSGKAADLLEQRGLSVHQMAVRKEIALRSSGRGFLSFSTPRGTGAVEDYHKERQSKYGFNLSQFVLHATPNAERKTAVLRWFERHGEGYTTPVPGLMDPRQQAIINDAIVATTRDVTDYILRKTRENAAKAGF